MAKLLHEVNAFNKGIKNGRGPVFITQITRKPREEKVEMVEELSGMTMGKVFTRVAMNGDSDIQIVKTLCMLINDVFGTTKSKGEILASLEEARREVDAHGMENKAFAISKLKEVVAEVK
jgi:hypothetical protein